MTVLAFLIVLALFTTVACVIRGFVLSVLWSWFMVPTFGLPTLGITASIGLCLVIGFIVVPLVSDNHKSEKKNWVEVLLESVFSPLLVLFVGWIIHCFM